jgi:hypothetical protein
VHDQEQAGRYLTEDDVIRDALERHRQAEPPPAKVTGQPELTPEEIADQELQRRLLAAGISSRARPSRSGCAAAGAVDQGIGVPAEVVREPGFR